MFSVQPEVTPKSTCDGHAYSIVHGKGEAANFNASDMAPPKTPLILF